MSVSVVLSFVAAFCLDFCFAASEGKVSKSAPEAKAKMIDWASLEVVDYLRSGALIAAFIGLIVADNKQRASRSGRKTNYFVNAEIIAWFVGGLAMFFFPANLLGYMMSKKLSALHLMQFQYAGAIMIGVAVSVAKLQPYIEEDGVVQSAWLLSRAVGYACAVLLNVQAHFTKDFFTVQHLIAHILPLILWFIVFLYQIVRSGNAGVSGSIRTSLTSGINRYIVLDVLFVMPHAFNLLANPRQAYKNFADVPFDDLTEHLGQITAVSMFMYYLFLLGTMHCDDDRVKKHFFLGRLVMMGLIMAVSSMNQWTDRFVSNNTFIVIFVLDLFQVVYCYMAYTYESGARQKSR